MRKTLRPSELCEVTGISPSYASQILSETRPCPPDIALAAFRAFGVRLGPIAALTDEDIAKLAIRPCDEPAPACHGGDAVASGGNGNGQEPVHSDIDTDAADAGLSGKCGDVTEQRDDYPAGAVS